MTIARPSLVHPRLLQLTALAALLGLSACAEQAEAPVGPAVEQVQVMTAQATSVALYASLNGRVMPQRVAQVRPQVDGVILERLFNEGSKVEKGQLLYQIDDKMYRAELARAQAEWARAEALVQAETARLKRARQLLRDKSISQQDFDDIAATEEQARASRALASANLEAARIQLEYTRIKAPIDGQIGRSLITEGALVTANQAQELARITQLDTVYVDLPRASDDFLRMRRALRDGALSRAAELQSQVQLQLEDGSTFPQAARLEFADVTVNETTSSLTLRLSVDNPQHDLLPGMFVRARLPEGVRDQIWLVPQRGVSRDRQGQASVLLANQDNRVEQRQISIERAIEDDWLVTEGLRDGDRIILDRLQFLRPGAEVKPLDGAVQHSSGPAEDAARG